jgi:transcriptional regulator with GAF, ATPase, and Fis domain
MNNDLHSNLENDSNAQGEASMQTEMREVVDAINLSDSLTAPLRRSIDELLQVAARVVGSLEASVLVRDGNEGGLRFLTALSKVKVELVKLHVPPGKGIAGLVFSSGQPMAVADVSQDGSFWSEADAKTGFKTITLLATPLHVKEEMIGVLEFVNRPGDAPHAPFTPEEMDRAAHFADAIARLVHAYELAALIEMLFERLLKIQDATPDAGGDQRANDLNDWLKNLSAPQEHLELLRMAISLREIVSRGDAERELCRDMLEALARFASRRNASSTSYLR